MRKKRSPKIPTTNYIIQTNPHTAFPEVVARRSCDPNGVAIFQERPWIREIFIWIPENHICKNRDNSNDTADTFFKQKPNVWSKTFIVWGPDNENIAHPKNPQNGYWTQLLSINTNAIIKSERN